MKSLTFDFVLLGLNFDLAVVPELSDLFLVVVDLLENVVFEVVDLVLALLERLGELVVDGLVDLDTVVEVFVGDQQL